MVDQSLSFTTRSVGLPFLAILAFFSAAFAPRSNLFLGIRRDCFDQVVKRVFVREVARFLIAPLVPLNLSSFFQSCNHARDMALAATNCFGNGPDCRMRSSILRPPECAKEKKNVHLKGTEAKSLLLLQDDTWENGKSAVHEGLRPLLLVLAELLSLLLGFCLLWHNDTSKSRL